MNSTWYNVSVVLLWLATMSWLVTQKVMPALLVGEPPSYREVIEAQHEDPLVGWSMSWNGQRVGWALNTTSSLPEDMTEVRSRVHFDDFPLREMMPDWLRRLLLLEDELPSGLQIEANSMLVFDPFQRLSQFESSVGFDGIEDVMKVRGRIDGAQLTLSVHTGDFTEDMEMTLPRNALLNDALSPQTQLPGLREGQSWTVEIYSPLRPPGSPTEILQATVEGAEPVMWDGRVVSAWLVVYRSDRGAGSLSTRTPRGRLWVRDDGTVLKQEVTLFNSTMTLERLSGGQAAALALAVEEGS